MPRKITPATTLETLRREAKRWLKALRAGGAEAPARLATAYPGAPEKPGLRDVQHALAREHDLESWTELKQALSQGDTVEQRPLLGGDAYETLAYDFAQAFNDRDAAALERLNRY